MFLCEMFNAVLPATPENVAKAKAFVLKKWKERAAELGQNEPADLSSSCKFTSMFAQRIFGGKLRGNFDHQYLVLPSGDILDLNVDAADVKSLASPHAHDQTFWNNPEHRESMKSCEARVSRWVEEFRQLTETALYYVQPDGSFEQGGDGRSKGLKKADIPKDAVITESAPDDDYYYSFHQSLLLAAANRKAFSKGATNYYRLSEKHPEVIEKYFSDYVEPVLKALGYPPAASDGWGKAQEEILAHWRKEDIHPLLRSD